ncbi:hypothetical protein GW17_00026511 [Ensete ventricosum]|nr:hypothetical protein GW17_00026511 [Ensete ventricosum]
MVSLRPLMTFTVGESVSQWPEMMRIALGTAWNTLDRHDFRNDLAGKLSSIDSVGDPCDKKNVSIPFPLIDRIRQPAKLQPNKPRPRLHDTTEEGKQPIPYRKTMARAAVLFDRRGRHPSRAPACGLDEAMAKMRDPHVVGRSESSRKSYLGD